MRRIDLRALDLNLLLKLDRLLEHRSVSAAARELGLSQPATSRALQRLRDALGDPLLVHVGRGLVPTDRALDLRGPVAEALEAARRVFELPAPWDPATASGELVLAMGDEAQLAYAAAVAVALWAEAPGIALSVRPLSVATVEEGRRGDLDVALSPDLTDLPASAGGVDLSEFVLRPLYRRRFVVASARPRGKLCLEDYLAADHVIVSFDGGRRGFVDDLLEAQGHRRRVAASVPSFTAAARLVAGTDLLCTLPEEVVWSSDWALHACPPPISLPEIPMLLVWHPRHTPDPRHRFLRELVGRTILASLG